MSTQRYISTSFWDDAWISSLDPSEKLLYLYLMTNPLTNISGVYKITLRRICFDTGFNEYTVKHLFEKFEGAGKAYILGEYIAIPSWPKHQKWEKAPKIKDGITACLMDLPAGILKKLVEIKYRFDLRPVFDTLCIPYIYPSSYSDIDIDIDIDTDIDASPSQSCEPAETSLEDQSSLALSSTPKPEKRSRKKSPPVRENPPSREEVQSYFESNKLLVDADSFYAYYTASEWRDKGGNDILNWKLTATTWNNRERKNNPNGIPYQRPKVNAAGQKLVGTIHAISICPNPKCNGARLIGDTCPNCRTTYEFDGKIRYKGDF